MSQDVSGTEQQGSGKKGRGANGAKSTASTKKQGSKKEWVHRLRVVARSFLGDQLLWVSDDLMPPVKFDVIYDEEGTRRLVKVDDATGIVRPISDDAVHAAVSDHMERTLAVVHRDFDSATASDIEHVRKFIVTMAAGIDQDTILPVAAKTQKGLAYERLAFDLDSKASAPTWDSILARCSNAMAIKAFIGSLFSADSDRSQFLYIYGAGDEGKGSMIEALSTIFGSAHTNQITPKELRFWLAGIYNKRLVTFSECDDFKFAMSEDMKAVTGNDTVSVDQKGQPIFKAKAICKFFYAANVKPRTQDTPAHRRRLIYSEIAPFTGEKVPYKVFVGKLTAEMHAFLSECWRTYQKLCPSGEVIPVEKEAFDALVQETTAEFSDIVDEYFVLDPRFACKPRDIETVFEKNRLNPKLKAAFVNYLKTRKVTYGNRYVVASVCGADGVVREIGERETPPGRVVRNYNALWGIAPKYTERATPQFRQSGTDPKTWAALLKQQGFPVAEVLF